MRLKKSTAAKLASLSAIGAGALILGGGEALANPVGIGPVIVNPPDNFVGFGSGASSHFGTGLKSTATAGFSFQRSQIGSPYGAAGRTRKVRFSSSHNNLKFRTFMTGGKHMLQLMNFGQTFSAAGSGSATQGTAARRFWKSFETKNGTSIKHTAINTGDNSSFYADFKFINQTGHTLYGWVNFDLINFNEVNGSTNDGPSLEINSYAYATDGSKLGAGIDPSQSEVPEPGTLGTAAMGALALGAVGLRRWRAARKKAA